MLLITHKSLMSNHNRNNSENVPYPALHNGPLEPDSDKLWGHLLIEAWVALEGEQESLGL